MALLQEKKNIITIIGLNIKYKNYLTGEIKETKFQGNKIDGDNIFTKELELKEGEYLSYLILILENILIILK